MSAKDEYTEEDYEKRLAVLKSFGWKEKDS
jgi:hypothetical protein